MDANYLVDTLVGDVARWWTDHGWKIFLILIVLAAIRQFGSKFVAQIIKRTVRKDLFPTQSDRDKRIKTLDSLITAFFSFFAWIIAIIMILDELDVKTGPLLASAGVVGVALGFGAQSLIKDFLSGVFIIIENQYRVGDVVELGKISGTVEGITPRTTIVRDLDGNLHHIPNGQISITTNKTMDFGNINIDIEVGYETDIDKLIHVINHVGEELAANTEFGSFIKEPPHFERIKAFGQNGIIIKILGKTAPSKQWRIRGELYKSLKKAFERNGIQIPYQQIVLHKEVRR